MQISIEPGLNPRAIHNEADLLAAAIHIDHYLVEEMNKIATDSPEIDALAKETQLHIKNNQNTLQDKAANDGVSPGLDITNNLKQLDSYNAEPVKSSLERLLACCDRSFVFYDAVVETAADESVMLVAQKLTSLALDRIALLKQTLVKQTLAEQTLENTDVSD